MHETQRPPPLSDCTPDSMFERPKPAIWRLVSQFVEDLVKRTRHDKPLLRQALRAGGHIALICSERLPIVSLWSSRGRGLSLPMLHWHFQHTGLQPYHLLLSPLCPSCQTASNRDPILAPNRGPFIISVCSRLAA